MGTQHQLIFDEEGTPTGVVIPIATWRTMVQDHPDLDPEAETSREVPEALKKIIQERLRDVEENPDDFITWEELDREMKSQL